MNDSPQTAPALAYLSEAHWEALRLLRSALVTSPAGVAVAQFRVANQSLRRALDWLEQYRFIEKQNDLYRLRPVSFVYLNDPADPSALAVARIFEEARKFYCESPGAKLPGMHIATVTGLSEGLIRQAFELICSTRVVSRATNGPRFDDVSITLQDSVLDFETWQSLADECVAQHGRILDEEIGAAFPLPEAPNWASRELSQSVPQWVARGEGQSLEFKSKLPDQVRDLGKEIAAFATSNDGTILVGVADNGQIAGLADVDTAEKRDALIRRIEGLTKALVPPVTPVVQFAVIAEKVVLVIQVAKGPEPLYYFDQRAYVRHLTEARPALPEEVIRLVMKAKATPVDDGRNGFYVTLLRILHGVLICADEMEERQVNPWLDLALASCEGWGSDLRNLAASSIASQDQVETDLEKMAAQLDGYIAAFQALGDQSTLDQALKAVVATASTLRDRLIKPQVRAEDARQQLDRQLPSIAKRLASLAERAEALVNRGRIEDVQRDASELGLAVRNLALLDFGAFKLGLGQALANLGRDLHLVETRTIYIDGGASANAVIADVQGASLRLNELLERGL